MKALVQPLKLSLHALATLVELLDRGLAQGLAVLALDVLAADLGHEGVPAHPDAAVDAPQRPGDVVAPDARYQARACW